MAVLAKAAKKLVVGGVLGALVGGKKAKATVMPLPQATRDDAAAMIAGDDEVRRRKGSAADMLTGVTGAEAALTGGRILLGN